MSTDPQILPVVRRGPGCSGPGGSRRRLMIGAAALVFIGLAVILPLPTAAEVTSLEVVATQTELAVGDRLAVVASARGGDGLLWGELTVALDPDGPWELIDGPTEVTGSRPPAWELVLLPMALGEQELPAITVSTRNPDGDTVEVGVDAPLVVTVRSVLSGDEEGAAPAPLRDPIGARGVPWEWILPVVGALLPLLAGVVWWWRGRGRSATAAVRGQLPPMAELEALAGELRERIPRDPADGICDRLAAGLRRYLERRTGEPAEEMTSFELRLLARRRGWPETTQRLIQRVMAVADGVRFGRFGSSEDELQGAIERALEVARSLEAHLTPSEVGPETAEAGG